MTQDRYESKGEEFWIVDEELDLDLKGKIETIEKDHFVTGELRYLAGRKGELLHGPSTYYNQAGQPISETWYFEGVKVGKSRRFYPTGQLYSMERFVEGAFHLAQEYYYLDGCLKTLIHYKNGQFHGETKLFWPDGTLKRRCHFSHGKQEGEDEIFDEEGRRIGAPTNPLS